MPAVTIARVQRPFGSPRQALARAEEPIPGRP